MRDQVRAAGRWLAHELMLLGVPSEQSDKACFALGQRLGMLEVSEDPWPTAQEVLARARRGEWDEPGEDFGKYLVEMKFGRPPDPSKFLPWLVKKLEEAVDESKA